MFTQVFEPAPYKDYNVRRASLCIQNPAAIILGDSGVSFYETDEQLGQYMEFHYGDGALGVDNYPRRCAELSLRLASGRQQALDLGCAVGRTSFELAREFEQVTAVDLSRRFIGAAEALRRDGVAIYQLREEGELTRECQVRLADLGLEETRERVRFMVGDAAAVETFPESHDLVFAGNLIDRLPDPAAFLADVHRHLKVGGLLILTSPYTLLEAFTPRQNWLGGFLEDGEPVTVLDGMSRVLAPHFEEVQAPTDLEFVIRETRRKFQHTVAQMTVWRRYC
jgi:putative 4-mercaptohistidine N1-methyltranferase